MALQFRQAPIVAEGSCITSDRKKCLAHAINDRIQSGLGDAAWRIIHAALNTIRQPRKPTALGAWPPQAEALEFYAHFDPDYSPTDWPVADHGDPEGVSPASPLGAFVAGRDSTGNEFTRTSVVEPFFLDAPPRQPATPSEYWEVGKGQRGGYDDSEGVQDWPAADAAESIFTFEFGDSETVFQLEDAAANPIGLSVREPEFNPHGKGYGGFLPQPEEIGDGTCGAGADAFRRNLEIKFTKFTDDPPTELTFPGTCDPSTDNGANDHVKRVLDTPFAWIVIEYGGTIHVLDKQHYTQGPYTGWGFLSKSEGRQMERAMNLHMHDLRGTQAQIDADRAKPHERCFRFDDFFSRQYPLAPAYAEYDSRSETLTTIYPEFTTSDDTPGTVLDCDQGGTSWATHTGYGFAGFLATVDNPTGTVTLEVLRNGVVCDTVTLDATDAEFLKYFAHPLDSGTVSVRVAASNTGTFDDVTVEILEQWIYQPQHYDAYLVARLITTENDTLAHIDGDGREFGNNVAWVEDFYERGFLSMQARNVVDEQTLMSNNPVYQAFRRFVSERIKWVRRQEFVKYEFDGTDSLLFFKRHVSGHSAADIFRGFAPQTTNVPSGEILEGRDYEVRGTGGDLVTYNSTGYAPGAKFTGVAGETDYTTSGFPTVLPVEGIFIEAPPGGLSNEWSLFIQTMAYSPSGTSTYKVDAFTDQFPFIDRCTHFAKGETGALPSTYQRHFHDASFTTDQGLQNPENPPGYRYLGTINTPNPPPGTWGGDKAEFAESCQIYPRPYLIKSIQSFEDGGTEFIQIKIDGRIQHSDDAPATIEEGDDDSWIDDETFRTDETALVEYMRYPGTDCDVKTGDSSISDDGDHQSVQGSCIPRFYFLKYLEKPYEDGNNTVDSTDTPIDAKWYAHAEWYLRYMCEGFVDSETTNVLDCETSAPATASEVYDLTWENLLLQTSNVVSVVPLLESIRSPLPEAFGPLPDQRVRAEIFNIYARAVNALTRVRVPIPHELEIHRKDYDGAEALSSPDEIAGTCGDAPPTRLLAYKENQELISTSLTTDHGWEVIGSSFTAESIQEITDNCISSTYAVERGEFEVDFRWKIKDSTLIHALSDEIQDLIEENSVVYARFQEFYHIPNIVEVESGGDFSQSGQEYQDIGTTIDIDECRLVANGDISTAITGSDLAFWRDTGETVPEAARARHSIQVTVASEIGTPIVEVPTLVCS